MSEARICVLFDPLSLVLYCNFLFLTLALVCCPKTSFYGHSSLHVGNRLFHFKPKNSINTVKIAISILFQPFAHFLIIFSIFGANKTEHWWLNFLKREEKILSCKVKSEPTKWSTKARPDSEHMRWLDVLQYILLTCMRFAHCVAFWKYLHWLIDVHASQYKYFQNVMHCVKNGCGNLA